MRYCSLHEAGGFPGTGADEADRGPRGNLLHVPLPKRAGGDAYRAALRDKALPFLLGRRGGGGADGGGGGEPPPAALLICAGFDALDGRVARDS